MIKKTQVGTQEYDKETGRVSLDNHVISYYFLGLKIYTSEIDYAENYYSQENKIGFTQ